MSRLIPINSADKYPRTTEAQNLQTSEPPVTTHPAPPSTHELLSMQLGWAGWAGIVGKGEGRGAAGKACVG